MVADGDWMRRVDDFRFANRINSRAEAIRILVNHALAATGALVGASTPVAASEETARGGPINPRRKDQHR